MDMHAMQKMHIWYEDNSSEEKQIINMDTLYESIKERLIDDLAIYSDELMNPAYLSDVSDSINSQP